MNIKLLKKLFMGVPLDYQLGYKDGFNSCLKIMKDTLKIFGKLNLSNIQEFYKKNEKDKDKLNQAENDIK